MRRIARAEILEDSIPEDRIQTRGSAERSRGGIKILRKKKFYGRSNKNKSMENKPMNVIIVPTTSLETITFIGKERNR